MSDFKMKQEIKNLIKMGFNEDMATLIVATKYGNLDLASDIVSSFAEENEAIKQELEKFKPYEPEDTSGIILYNYANHAGNRQAIDEKYGVLDLASETVSSMYNENDMIREFVADFKPYAPEDTSGIIIIPSDASSSSAEIYPLEYLDINDTNDNIILSSNSIEERNDKNEIENI
jgi:hypothetical protein